MNSIGSPRMDSMGGVGGDISATIDKTQMDKRAEEAQLQSAVQEETDKDVLSQEEEDAGSVKQMNKKQESTKTKLSERTTKTEKTDKTNESKEDNIDSKAEEHSKKNPELAPKSLKQLRERIKDDSSDADILAIVQSFCPHKDPMLIDDCLGFLLDTTKGKLQEKIVNIKANFEELHENEIISCRNIAVETRHTMDQKLGQPTSVRELYLKSTINPSPAFTQYKELKIYAYPERIKLIDCLLHSIGADTKARGASIEDGRLHDLNTEVRNLQAIKGVYRFFISQIPLVKKQFNENATAA